MSNNNKHIIQKQVLEVEMQNSLDAFQFRNKLGDVYHEKILPQLEILFDEMGKDNRLIRMNELQIDVGTIDLKNWEAELTEKTVAAVRESLVLRNPILDKTLTVTNPQPGMIKAAGNLSNELSVAEKMEIFIYFLKTGRLPWYASTTIQPGELLAELITTPAITELIYFLSKATDDEIIRFIYQATEPLLDEVLKHSMQQSNDPLYQAFMLAKPWVKFFLNSQAIDNATQLLYFPLFVTLRKKMAVENTNGEEAYAAAFIQELNRNRVQTNILIFDSDNDQPGNTLPGLINKLIKAAPIALSGKDNTKTTGNNFEEPLFINNAGLVLLHPFLQPYFKALDLTDGKDQFVNEYAAMKAVLLSQYLVNGSRVQPEYQLVLNKICCGYPVEKPIITKLEISLREKEETESLLQQVIQLWKKNAVQVNGTTAGLQQSFLQRAGRLIHKENGWHLQVEQKPYDLLLSTLPWGFSIIKTPWMQTMLWVDWT